jgi:ELWxxDGT repeat protein
MNKVQHILFTLLFLSGTALFSQATFLVKNIHPSFGSHSYPQNLTNVNGTLFFSADNGSQGFELWKSGGTSANTVMIKDLTPGSAGTQNMRDFITVNGKLFFSCKSGRELWISDGTSAGTDTILTSSSFSFFKEDSYIELNNNLIFVTQDQSTYNLSLWKSGGTSATTSLIKTFNSGGLSIHYSTYKIYNNNLYFVADDGTSGREVWKTDGTTSGTTLVKDINSGSSNGTAWPDPPFFNEVNGELLFLGNEGTNGEELWKTNGTSAGTILVKDVNSGAGGSGITLPITTGDKLFFKVFVGGITSLWVSDGATLGTSKVIDLSYCNFMVALDSSKLIFAQDNTSPINYGRELWISDGTTLGTKILKDIYPGTTDGIPTNHFLTKVIDTILYFKGIDALHGEELWKTNGTDTGTVLVKDMNPGTGNGFVPNGEYFYDANGILIFDGYALGSATSTEFWRSDGTDTGTIRYDIDTNFDGSYPKLFTLIDTTLFFVANDGFKGRELYASYVDSIPKAPDTSVSHASLFEIKNKLEVKLYPNPTSSNIWISINKNEIQNVTNLSIQLIDISGKVILYKNLSQHKFSLDLSNYSDGMYFLEIFQNKERISSYKVIKD